MPAHFADHRFRVVIFNVENLFVRFDRPAPADLSELSEADWQKLTISLEGNKPLRQTEGVARAIRELDPDLVLLCEVGGRESLENFNARFLGDTYQPLLIEGNSDRGIDVGYLVRASLDCAFELVSHKDRAIDFLYPHERLSVATGYAAADKLTSHRFSRDVLELRLRACGESEPSLIVLLTHLKSQLDRDHIDPQGRDRRRAELEKLVQIYTEIFSARGKDVPILLGGDLNGSAASHAPDAEFAALHRDTDLQDALEIAGVTFEERHTFMQIQNYGTSRNRQLDYLFVPPKLAPLMMPAETFVHRFADASGRLEPVPRTVAEKRLLPSDHYPLVVTFASLR